MLRHAHTYEQHFSSWLLRSLKPSDLQRLLCQTALLPVRQQLLPLHRAAGSVRGAILAHLTTSPKPRLCHPSELCYSHVPEKATGKFVSSPVKIASLLWTFAWKLVHVPHNLGTPALNLKTIKCWLSPSSCELLPGLSRRGRLIQLKGEHKSGQLQDLTQVYTLPLVWNDTIHHPKCPRVSSLKFWLWTGKN